MKKLLIVILLLLPTVALGYKSLGSPTGFVNDYAGLLGTEERLALEKKLSDFQSSTGNEIVVVTIQSLEGDTVENYAEKLFQEWGIGKAKQDNGVLLLISKDDRELRIEVGYGLESQLTDIYSSRLIREVLTPAFKEGNYYAGIDSATTKIIASLSGGNVDLPRGNDVVGTTLLRIANFPIILFLVLASFLASILARSKSWWAGGVVGFIIALILGFIFTKLVGLISGIVLIPVGLLFDYIISKTYKRSIDNNHRPPWWIGGSGFGGGGGRGFGGFGGGMSGGGGASGRW